MRPGMRTGKMVPSLTTVLSSGEAMRWQSWESMGKDAAGPGGEIEVRGGRALLPQDAGRAVDAEVVAAGLENAECLKVELIEGDDIGSAREVAQGGDGAGRLSGKV